MYFCAFFMVFYTLLYIFMRFSSFFYYLFMQFFDAFFEKSRTYDKSLKKRFFSIKDDLFYKKGDFFKMWYNNYFARNNY